MEAIEAFFEVGFSGVYIHQVGPDQQPMLDLYATQVLPAAKKRFARSDGVAVSPAA